MKKCDECRLATLRELGYSCYTIDGTYVYCDHHPESGFDRWYGEEKKLLYAEHCEHFVKGTPEFEPFDCGVEDKSKCCG